MITPSFGITATERVLPKLALDFTTGSLDSRITFTRTTGASNPATYVNSSGIITAATNNQPRFDYDAATLTCKGLLIEESRSNLCTYSQELTTGWTAFATTRTANASVSPDNTNNAVKLESNVATSSAHQNYQIGKTITNGSAYTASCYMKAAECSVGIINHYDTGAGNIRTYFDLSNGTVGTVGAGVTASIFNAGNGWYRCVATRTVASTSGGVSIEFSNADNVNTTIIAIGSGVYIYGAQYELGAFATSYIPTTTTALTRNADVATMTGTNFSDWFNASEGTFTISFVPFRKGVFQDFVSAASASNSYLSINDDSYGNCRFQVNNAGSVQASMTRASITVGSVMSACAAYKTDSFCFATIGGSVITDTSGTVPTTNALYIGARYTGVNLFSGYVQKIAYCPQRITNNEVSAFSKG